MLFCILLFCSLNFLVYDHSFTITIRQVFGLLIQVLIIDLALVVGVVATLACPDGHVLEGPHHALVIELDPSAIIKPSLNITFVTLLLIVSHSKEAVVMTSVQGPTVA